MPQLTNQIVIAKAKEVGFDIVGFAKADIIENESEKLKLWLEKGHQADMDYMVRNFEKRKDIKKVLRNAESVISLGLNYYTSEQYSEVKQDGKTSLPLGKVSRYAWGKDYHLIIWNKLFDLEFKLKQIDPKFESISYVDTGPVMDKAWAVRAGLGWLGKHTNVISKEQGSWFFIANIITNCKFEYSDQILDHCGDCTACLDACPTNAIVQEYVVDANKCISYHTIENKNDIPKELKGKFENWIFGCDICQDVCPWNQKFSEPTSIRDFYPKTKEITLDEALKMDNSDFKKRFAESPIKRTKLKGLKRNAKFLIE
jgi:epoxyqueuosine reductase